MRGVLAIEAVVLAAVSTTAPRPSSTLCFRCSWKVCPFLFFVGENPNPQSPPSSLASSSIAGILPPPSSAYSSMITSFNVLHFSSFIIMHK
ncbi:hypothetical protein PIB30_091112, partial [Stylosanthes scabra]|nr:hypothetical protein [Stylosanthes scabra]